VGVPATIFALSDEIPFNDAGQASTLIRRLGDRLAAVVIEPVVEREPTAEWLRTLREETERGGALFVVDELKTGLRLGLGGATARYGIQPDLVVLGKALANGFPLAAVGGRRDVMERARETWISSTLATEMVSLAAADATLRVMAEQRVPEHLARVGRRLYEGLEALAARHPDLIAGVAGIPEMVFLRFAGEERGALVARAAARQGLIFKRTAYNFVSLAHDDARVDAALGVLGEACAEVLREAT
jgi:glutamate-1-semialdehyde 2,1-aminomutase